MTAATATDSRGNGRRRAPRLLAGAVSLAAHGLILLLVLYSIRPAPPLAPPIATVVTPVELVPPPKLQAPPSPTPAPAPATPSPVKKAPKKPPPKPGIVHASKLPAPAELDAGQGDAPGVSDADLAGAAVAGRGSGGGGGSCDMLSRLQAALRKDPLVAQMAAEAQPAGRAILVWNGDWVRSGSEDGKGMTAVREAILWTVGFAPAACRSQEVNGLVLITLGRQPGAARLVLGTGRWRWSDLLQLHH